MAAYETAVANSDRIDYELPILDPQPGKLRINADADVISNAHAIPGINKARIEHAATANLCSHRAPKERCKRRTIESRDETQVLKSRNDPPTNVSRPPQRIAPRPITADNQPFGGDRHHNERHPRGEPDCKDNNRELSDRGPLLQNIDTKGQNVNERQ